MRDQSIILLTTSCTQSLEARPSANHKGKMSGTEVSENYLVAWGTGSRTPNAYWRITRVPSSGNMTGSARTFEALAWPGRFLRIVGPGECDVMVGELLRI